MLLMEFLQRAWQKHVFLVPVLCAGPLQTRFYEF